MTRLAAPSTPRLEGSAEVVRREHERAIRELQALPTADVAIISDISLVDGVETPVAHRLGRLPRMLSVSPPRGASSTGRIEEVRTGDRTQVVTLKATGWGATITVDIEAK